MEPVEPNVPRALTPRPQTVYTHPTDKEMWERACAAKLLR